MEHGPQPPTPSASAEGAARGNSTGRVASEYLVNTRIVCSSACHKHANRLLKAHSGRRQAAPKARKIEYERREIGEGDVSRPEVEAPGIDYEAGLRSTVLMRFFLGLSWVI